MKALWTLASAFALSTTAMAGQINYDFRGDFNNTTYSDAAGLPNYSKFYFKTGRLDFKGNLNEAVSYELRWGFYKPAADSTNTTNLNQTRDSVNGSVELAYVTHKFSDNFAWSLGKFNTEIGGFEGATSGADLYMVSPNYAHSAVTTLAGGNLGINQGTSYNLLYNTGIKANYSFADQTQNIYLVLTNGANDPTTTPQGGTSGFDQNRGLMGLVWKGSFMDKTLTGLVSYHELAPQSIGTTTTFAKDDKHSFISAGVKYDANPWFGSLEYLTTEFKNNSVASNGNKDTLYSVVGKLGYTIGQWTPRLEVFTSEEKRNAGVSQTNDFTGVGAVVEYKPTTDNFRYHIAYNTIASKMDASSTISSATKNEIVAGVRMFGDFLK